MDIASSSGAPPFVRLFERFSSYIVVGFSTFLFDLSLIWLFINKLNVSESTAISIAFLIAVHINYTALRYWVYQKTHEQLPRTYTYFITLALSSAVILPSLVVWCQQMLGVEMFKARVIVAAVLGTIGFLFNTFFNFKLL